MEKIILIPESNTSGNGKMRFSVLDGKLFLEIIDKPYNPSENKNYKLEFRTDENLEIEKSIRDHQISFISKLLEARSSDYDNIIRLYHFRYVSEEIYKFDFSVSDEVKKDIIFNSKHTMCEIKRGYMPHIFSVIEEAFSNQSLVSFSFE